MLAVVGVAGSRRRRRDESRARSAAGDRRRSGRRDRAPGRASRDLAVLSFLASLAFMALEMVAGRLVTRHLGSSIYGWTSVIGVLLGGLSLGNYLGGKIADPIQSEKQASWLFLVASVLTLCDPAPGDARPKWLRDKLGWATAKPVLSHGDHAGPSSSCPAARRSRWPGRIACSWWSTLVFFLPSVAMGTVSPVVAKLAVERLGGSSGPARRSARSTPGGWSAASSARS